MGTWAATITAWIFTHAAKTLNPTFLARAWFVIDGAVDCTRLVNAFTVYFMLPRMCFFAFIFLLNYGRCRC
jgi:hypothetical protein